MTKTDLSPRTLARITGALYLVTVVAGVLAQGFISERLVASNDAQTTAANIVSQASLFRLGFTVYMIEMAAQIAMTTLFYELLRPVSKNVSLLSAVFGLVGCTVKTMSRLFYYAPLLALGGARYLSVFSPEQLNAWSLFLLNINDYGAGIALALFGFAAVLRGYLVIKSTFFPRALGVVGLVSGVALLAFLSPPLGLRLFPYIAGIGFLGSVAMILWLLVVGVNEQRWREQASAQTA
jgi:uncharacterized protein DUF4386